MLTDERQARTNRTFGPLPRHSDATLLAYCTDARPARSIAEALGMSAANVHLRLVKLESEGRVTRSKVISEPGEKGRRRACWGWTRAAE